MLKITAKGKVKGKDQVVIYHDGEITPDAAFIWRALCEIEPIGGTYWPDMLSPLNVMQAMRSRIFDSEPQITVIGELPKIPYDPDVIY